jgi:tetratricopeptide (TPR) repeat protein
VTTQLRRTIVATLLAFSFVGLAIVAGSAQQAAGTAAAGQGASAGAPAPAQTPAPRAVPPEQKAYTDAMALTDMSARVAALEKVRSDFPESAFLATVDNGLLTTLAANFPDRLDAINATFDRIIGRIPADATPENRLQRIQSPINTVVGKKLLLDRSEALLKDAIAALDPEKYAQAQRDLDARAKAAPVPAGAQPRPERTQAQIEQAFGQAKGQGLDSLAKVYVAKGDNAKAEATYKQAVTANPQFSVSTQALVDIYTGRNDYASAESLLKEAIKASATPAAATRPQQVLADVYIKKGDDANAEATLNDILKTNATLTAAIVPLARLEAKRGDDAKALDHFMTAALAGSLKPADEATMESLYAKVNKNSGTTLEGALDKAYRDKFPNPVKPEAYQPSAARTNKLVLLELFTGSGCPPCVASDLALDAAMARYADNVISLVYHEHIPQPDPMVAANNNDRRLYYSVSGVPTFEIDGSMVANAQGSNPGGGARNNTPNVYNNYTHSIDKALEAPAKAALTVKATGEGDQISVTVNVSALPADAKDLRLHIVLAEKELKFTGENGIRFHPMAVRATAGEKGAGIPITAAGTTKYTFSLSQIKDDVTKSLAAELDKRLKGLPAGATKPTYMAEDHAYTAIDTSELVVVAFVQDGAYRAPKPDPSLTPNRGGGAGAAGAGEAGASPAPQAPTAKADVQYANVLNAAKADVVFAPASNKKGGGR